MLKNKIRFAILRAYVNKSKRMGRKMALLQEWRDFAYSHDDNSKEGQQFWLGYFSIEKGIYQEILKTPDQPLEGTVKELAERFDTEISMIVGFLDGISESLKEAIPLDTLEEDTFVSVKIDVEKLYYNMVGARAEWLYELPEWDNILSEEKRKELYREQKSSTTVVKPPKIGRNDPCPCGSGKKYKKCCG